MASVTKGGLHGPTKADIQLEKLSQFGKSMQSMGQGMRAYSQLRENKRQFDIDKMYDVLEYQSDNSPFGAKEFAQRNPDMYKAFLSRLYGKSDKSMQLVEKMYEQITLGNISLENAMNKAESALMHEDVVGEEVIASVYGDQEVTPTLPTTSEAATRPPPPEMKGPTETPTVPTEPRAGVGRITDIWEPEVVETDTTRTIPGRKYSEEEKKLLPHGMSTEPLTVVGPAEERIAPEPIETRTYPIEQKPAEIRSGMAGTISELPGGEKEYIRPRGLDTQGKVFYDILKQEYGMNTADMYSKKENFPKVAEILNNIYDATPWLEKPTRLEEVATKGLGVIEGAKLPPKIGNFILPGEGAAPAPAPTSVATDDVAAVVSTYSKSPAEAEKTVAAVNKYLTGHPMSTDTALANKVVNKAVTWAFGEHVTPEQRANLEPSLRLINTMQKYAKSTTGEDHPLVRRALAKVNKEADTVAAAKDLRELKLIQARTAQINAKVADAKLTLEQDIFKSETTPGHPMYEIKQQQIAATNRRTEADIMASEASVMQSMVRQAETEVAMYNLQNPEATPMNKDQAAALATDRKYFIDQRKSFAEAALAKHPANAVKAARLAKQFWDSFLVGPELQRYTRMEVMSTYLMGQHKEYPAIITDAGTMEDPAATAFTQKYGAGQSGFSVR